MSPRAASRLESLGFTRVFDYVAGEADWLAFGLPTEGDNADMPRAAQAAQRDVPTCVLTDQSGAVRDRLRGGGWELCVVVNERGVVLGRVRVDALDGKPEQTIDALMEAGPTTVRPDESLAALVLRMRDRKTRSVIVSTSDGVLVGVLRRDDAERELADQENA